MRTLITTLSLITTLCLVGATPARAQDDAASGDLQKLLDNLPTIETKEAPPPEKPAEEPEEGMDLPAYVAEVRATVLANWNPSPKLIQKNPSLSCQMLVKIGEDGTVGDVIMTQPSGNKKFDQSAGDAALATAKVLAPSYGLRGTAASGILVNFVAATKLPRP